MALLVDDLQGQVGRSAAEGLVDGIEVVGLFGEAEVSDQSVAIFIEHNILWFEVAIDDVVLVECLNAQQYLSRVVLHLLFRELLALLQQSRQISTFAVIHNEEEIGLSLEGISQSDYERMVEQTEDVFLSLDVSVEIGAEDAFLPDGFEGVELRLLFSLDEVHLSECAFSDLLVELEGRKRDGFDLLVLPYELVELEDVLLPKELSVPFLLLLLSLRNHFLDVLVLQHLLDHCTVVGSVSVHRVLFLYLSLSLVFLK